MLFQDPAGGLDCAAFDLIDHAVRIDGFTNIDRDRQSLDADVFGALDLGDHGTIGAGVFVARKTEAITNAGSLLRLPIGAPGDGADHILSPLIRQMTQPEGDRILAALGRQFVEERFNGKDVALRAQRPQRGGADRHGQQTMTLDLPRREIIERYRIAIGAAATGLRRIGRDIAWKRICKFSRREQRRLRRASGPRGVAVAPDAVSPADDLVLRIEIGLDLDRHRRPERRMRHLVRARPLHAHRPAAGCFCEQHRVERDVVGGIMAVAAGALHMFDRDVLER